MLEATVPIGLEVGEYQVTGFLGEGGMGTVYAGVHPIIGKKVAIKVLSPQLAQRPSLVARFVQEARAVNRIGHPNIIDVFAFGESPQLGHYFVMPLLEGESLGERLIRGPLSVGEAVEVLDKIADALAAAHAAGIYHRDLKPDNIFLAAKPTGGYTVKILDFGLAKLNDGGAMTVTETGVPMGTPMFMSPEQWEGIDVDHRTDIYALGVLLHHMVTGDFPFSASTPVALMRAHCDAAPRLPSAAGGPPALDPVVARALAKRKEQRFQSTAELVDSLKTAAAGGSVPMPPLEVTGAAPAAPGRRSRWPMIAVAVALAGLAGTAVALALSSDGDVPQPAASTASSDISEIRVKSRPKGAAIVSRDGETLGTTPETLELPARRDEVVELTLRKPGYRDLRIEITPGRDRYKPFRLEPATDGSVDDATAR